MEQNIIGSNNYIYLILYFKKLEQINFFKFEIDLIKWLIEENKKIIFVVNDLKYHKKSDINKFYEIMKASLEKIISTIPKDKKDKINKEEILNNIVIINLRQSIDEYEDDNGDTKIIIKQCYGIDILFKKIYDLFIKEKISIDEIKNTNNTKEILNKIQKYKSLKKIKDFTNFHLNTIKLKTAKLIFSFSYKDYFDWLMKDKRRNELIEKINNLYEGDKINDIDKLIVKYKTQVDKIEKKV